MKRIYATLSNEWLFAALVLGFWVTAKLYALSAHSLFNTIG